jgi:hypothetical protein
MLNLDLEEILPSDIKPKIQDHNSPKSNFISTFNVSMPLKESLLGPASTASPNNLASTVYASNEICGEFAFNPKNVPNQIIGSPKLSQQDKLDFDLEKRHQSVPKNLFRSFKPKSKAMKLTNRDRGKLTKIHQIIFKIAVIFALGIKPPKLINKSKRHK